MKLLSIYIFILQLILCYGYTRVTNIKCESLNKDLCTMNICKLKILGRGKIGVDVHINNTGPPFREAKVNYSIWRKLSGYHPFLFNVTVDFCHLMGHPNRLNVFYYFHRAILPFSNINHTCPYDHDLIVKDFLVTDEMFARVPFPRGSYMLNLKVFKNGMSALDFHFYLDIDVKQTLRSNADGE